MNKHFILTVFVLLAVGFSGCGETLYVDTQILQEEIYDPAAVKYDGLEQSTVLYFDQSTCLMKRYRDASGVFVALRPQLGQYCDTMQLMQGRDLKTIVLSRGSNRVSEALEEIDSDIPYTDIRGALFRICNSDQQAVLITDGESWFDTQEGTRRNLDLEAYFSEPFRNWLRRGYSIYIVVEPYQERLQNNLYDKKRFYFFFTDDRMEAPITHMLNEIEPFRRDGSCFLFKLTNSDIFVKREGDMIHGDLSSTYEQMNGFDYITIDDKWESIRTYVMKLDKYGQPVPEDEPDPLIKNLYFNDGNNYIISDAKVIATNVTARYLSFDCDEASRLKLDCNSISPNDKDMSEGFMLDKTALKNNELKVLLTDKIFNFLTDEYGGNLIRLDFVITDVRLNPVDTDMFSWQSLFSNGRAICVSQGIVNALRDAQVLPHSAEERRVIHTVFIKTESYKNKYQ